MFGNFFRYCSYKCVNSSANRLKAVQKHTGCSKPSILFELWLDMDSRRLFKDVQHIFYEGEWPKHIEAFLLKTDKYDENKQFIEIQKIVNTTTINKIVQRLNVYPFRNSQHKLKNLDFLGSSTSSQTKDFMESLPIVLRGLFSKQEECHCRGTTCVAYRPLPANIQQSFKLSTTHTKYDHYCCLVEVN
jgi:hypothetical protein